MPETLTCGLCLRQGQRGFDLHFDASPLYRCTAREACATRRRQLAEKEPARLLAGRTVLAVEEILEQGVETLRVRLDRGLTVYIATGDYSGLKLRAWSVIAGSV